MMSSLVQPLNSSWERRRLMQALALSTIVPMALSSSMPINLSSAWSYAYLTTFVQKTGFCVSPGRLKSLTAPTRCCRDLTLLNPNLEGKNRNQLKGCGSMSQ
jgi:hypothetical protein